MPAITSLKIIHPRILFSYLSGTIPQNKKQEDIILQNKTIQFHAENEVRKILENYCEKSNKKFLEKPPMYNSYSNTTYFPNFLVENMIIEIVAFRFFNERERLKPIIPNKKFYSSKSLVILCGNVENKSPFVNFSDFEKNIHKLIS